MKKSFSILNKSKSSVSLIYIAILCSVLLANFLGFGISEALQLMLLTILVIILGLPHGALDFEVAKSMHLVDSITSSVSFLIGYLFISASAILFWINFPTLGLVLFLSLSIWHFAADWRNILSKFMPFCVSSAVLCGPSLLYQNEVRQLFIYLLLTPSDAQMVVEFMRGLFFLAIGFLAYTSCKRIYHWSGRGRKTLILVAELLALLVSSVILPPLVHFVLYFCFLHSPKHLIDVSEHLNVSLKSSLVLSLPLTFISVCIAYLVYFYNASDSVNIDLIRWVFIGLFGLTVSHMSVVYFWHHWVRKTLFT